MMKPTRRCNAFPGQREDEQIFVYTRHHAIKFLPYAVMNVMFYLAPLITMVFMSTNDIILDPEWKNIGALLFGLYWLIVSFVFMVSGIGFYYDLYIVTDRRIVSINQHRLFSRNISEISFEAIQDIDTSAKNFWQLQFNYGDIIIRTSADNTSFPLKDIPSPKKIAYFITDLLEQTRNGVEPLNRKSRGSMIAYIHGQTIYHGDHIPAIVNLDRDLNAINCEDGELN